jgi:hypothetical protein
MTPISAVAPSAHGPGGSGDRGGFQIGDTEGDGHDDLLSGACCFAHQ